MLVVHLDGRGDEPVVLALGGAPDAEVLVSVYGVEVPGILVAVGIDDGEGVEALVVGEVLLPGSQDVAHGAGVAETGITLGHASVDCLHAIIIGGELLAGREVVDEDGVAELVGHEHAVGHAGDLVGDVCGVHGRAAGREGHRGPADGELALLVCHPGRGLAGLLETEGGLQSCPAARSGGVLRLDGELVGAGAGNADVHVLGGAVGGGAGGYLPAVGKDGVGKRAGAVVAAPGLGGSGELDLASERADGEVAAQVRSQTRTGGGGELVYPEAGATLADGVEPQRRGHAGGRVYGVHARQVVAAVVVGRVVELLRPGFVDHRGSVDDVGVDAGLAHEGGVAGELVDADEVVAVVDAPVAVGTGSHGHELCAVGVLGAEELLGMLVIVDYTHGVGGLAVVADHGADDAVGPRVVGGVVGEELVHAVVDGASEIE